VTTRFVAVTVPKVPLDPEKLWMVKHNLFDEERARVPRDQSFGRVNDPPVKQIDGASDVVDVRLPVNPPVACKVPDAMAMEALLNVIVVLVPQIWDDEDTVAEN
jgi:hypothetical protein